MDVMTPEQRSRCMSRIRGSDTQPERALRSILWRRGLRYRLRSKLPGRPDITFHRGKIAVFVDGCFWHACPEHATKPKTNSAFWNAKISGNVERDNRVNKLLAADGWLVLRFWEHEVEQSAENIANVVAAAVEKRTTPAGATRR
jgi:DNA mismatch endonuclease, patch repair protein